MTDLEKVIKALEICVGENDFSACINEKCPYIGGSKDGYCITNLERDALALLKEQEAVKPTWSQGKPFCGACGLRIRGGKICSECGTPILWEGR